MRKLTLVFLALLLLTPIARAANLPLVVDEAGVLTAAEAAALEAEAGRISAEYGMDVVVLTVDSIGNKSAQNYAADFFDYEGYGQGADNSGVLLLVAMEARDWYILTTGAGIETFTDYGLDVISEDIVPYLSDGDYAGGFARFLSDADQFLREARGGRPYDTNNRVHFESPWERTVGAAGYLLIAAVVIAGVGLLILARGMNTARPQYAAHRYVREGSMNITRAGDFFLYHTQTRVKIPKNESGGGGSSTFKGSSGTSHGGKGGKF